MNDLEKLKARKEDIEEAVLNMITQLEKDFGVTVDGINHFRCNFSDGRSRTVDVDIRVIMNTIL